MTDAADALSAAAQHMANRRFASFPPYSSDRDVYQLRLIGLAALSAEIRRNPLGKQLDGAGGAAGSAEFNPYVRALVELERVTHRRLYRVLYQLAEHLGVELRGDGLFDRPEVVDTQQL